MVLVRTRRLLSDVGFQSDRGEAVMKWIHSPLRRVRQADQRNNLKFQKYWAGELICQPVTTTIA